MEQLPIIDDVISTQLSALRAVLEPISFTEICQFELSTAKDDIPLDDLIYPGLYLFEIEVPDDITSYDQWVNEFVTMWRESSEILTSTPRPIQKRINAHKTLTKWMPFYIGKRSNIKDRIRSHLWGKPNSATFALKLGSRECFEGAKFRLSTIRLDVTNYSTIVPVAENFYRDRINPIVGKA